MSNIHHYAGQEVVIGENAAEGFAPSDSGKSWKVTVKKGIHNGIGASVSGAGARAHVTGSFSFTTRTLESSAEYHQLKTKYNFSAGTSGFWNWLVGGARTSAEREEIQSTFHSMSKATATQGKVNIDLLVTGQIPNFQVDASAYVLIMMVTDAQGNTYEFASGANPQGDTGATNLGAKSPSQQPVVTDNNSTISI